MSSEMGESHCLHFARGEFEKRGTPQLEDRIGPDRTQLLRKWDSGEMEQGENKFPYHSKQNIILRRCKFMMLSSMIIRLKYPMNISLPERGQI